ncbi:MAG: hypothetical protein ABIT96_07935 [Ferruginibacter sp.]
MEKLFEGTISFIEYKKNYAVIDYEAGGKVRNVKAPLGSTNTKTKIAHHYSGGDRVRFALQPVAGGKISIATNLKFLYNNARNVLADKSRTDNHFRGYIKEAGGEYFIKEAETYLFIPLLVSTWQILPPLEKQEELVNFFLEGAGKNEKLTATLVDNNYIKEYRQAIKFFKNETETEVVVHRVTPFAIHADLFSPAIKVKLLVEDVLKCGYKSPAPGDIINVKILHLTPWKIIVQPLPVNNTLTS